MSIAYATRAGYTADNCGVLALGDSSLDVRQALVDGDGIILVPEYDTATIARLDDYEPLKRVSPKKATEDTPVTDRFEHMTAADLRDVAKNELGLENPGRSRDELLAAVRAASNPNQEA